MLPDGFIETLSPRSSPRAITRVPSVNNYVSLGQNSIGRVSSIPSINVGVSSPSAPPPPILGGICLNIRLKFLYMISISFILFLVGVLVIPNIPTIETLIRKITFPSIPLVIPKMPSYPIPNIPKFTMPQYPDPDQNHS